MKKAGYATGMTGKWHLGPQAEIVTHGFDDVYYKNANRPGWANFNLDGSDREAGVYDQPVISLDVAATACAMAGLEQDSKLDGVNLIPYLCGETQGAPHETLYWRWIAQAAVREGNCRYLRGGTREYLYDLDADREEKHNVLAEHPVPCPASTVRKAGSRSKSPCRRKAR